MRQPVKTLAGHLAISIAWDEYTEGKPLMDQYGNQLFVDNEGAFASRRPRPERARRIWAARRLVALAVSLRTEQLPSHRRRPR